MMFCEMKRNVTKRDKHNEVFGEARLLVRKDFEEKKFSCTIDCRLALYIIITL